MMPGDVWWARVGDVLPVVLLSAPQEREIRAVFVVEPARVNIDGVCVELPIGRDEGLPDARVVRVATPQEGAIPCNWLVTLGEDDLVERAGALSAEKLQELMRMMTRAGLD